MKRAALAALALGAGTTWNMSSVGSLADPTAAAYDVSLVIVGLFTGALVLTHFLVQLPAGRAADRFGARRVGVAAAAACVVGNVLAYTTPSPAVALVARAICGLGSGAGFVAGADLMRAAGLSAVWRGAYGASTMVGGGLAVAIVPRLEPSLDWRAPYVSGGVIAAAIAVVVAGVPSLPRVSHRTAVVLDRRLVPHGAIHAASFGVSYLAASWIVPLLERHGTSRGPAAAIGALVLLGGAVTRVGGGVVMERAPQLARVALGAGLVGGTVAGALLALPLPLAIHAFATLLAGLSAGIPFAIVFGSTQLLRPDAPAAAVAFVNSFAIAFLLVATPLAGAAFSLPGEGRIAFAAIGALCLATLPAVRAIDLGYRDAIGTKSRSSAPT
ncbi:MAG: MFS transporter [Gaiellales bacterium]